MALEEIELPTCTGPLPAAIASLFAEADRRIDHLFETNRNRRLPRFLPSDPALLYAAMVFLTEQDLPTGRTFCEWGSGFGVGASLASLLGYKSYGIEIEPELADYSRELARDLDLDVEILCCSYFPEGYASAEGQGGTDLICPSGNLHPGAAEVAEQYPSYDGMNHDIDEIDLFFVYPWPGEQELMQQLFDALAADGAILIAYFGDRDICAYRKIVEEGLQ